jgi:hypothetical protein
MFWSLYMPLSSGGMGKGKNLFWWAHQKDVVSIPDILVRVNISTEPSSIKFY